MLAAQIKVIRLLNPWKPMKTKLKPNFNQHLILEKCKLLMPYFCKNCDGPVKFPKEVVNISILQKIEPKNISAEVPMSKI